MHWTSVLPRSLNLVIESVGCSLGLVQSPLSENCATRAAWWEHVATAPRPTASPLPADRRHSAVGCLTVLHACSPVAATPAHPAGCPPSTINTGLDGALVRIVRAVAFLALCL